MSRKRYEWNWSNVFSWIFNRKGFRTKTGGFVRMLRLQRIWTLGRARRNARWARSFTKRHGLKVGPL